MKPSSTDRIVVALTQAIVEHRLQPGAKLVEQALASHFGVSRTLVRQALFLLSQKRLVTLEPARGAFVASPSVAETRQVFAGDTDAVVGDGKPPASFGFAAPGKQDLSTLRRIAHGVSRQIGKRRTQFPGTAQQPPRPMIF